MKIKLFVILLFISSLVGCTKPAITETQVMDNETSQTNEVKIDKNNKNSDYILTSKNGNISLFNISGDLLDELILEKSDNSDFIYCEDSGNVYSNTIKNKDNFNSIFYAVDKSNGHLFMIKNYENKLKLIKDKSLKESKDILEIKAFNGVFYYLVKGNGKSSNKFTVAKISNDKSIINSSVQIPVERRGKTYSYIYLDNLSDVFIENMYGKILTDSDISNMNLIDLKKSCFRIPYDIDSWTITNNLIIFYAKDICGSYDMKKDIINPMYGLNKTIKSIYVSGKKATIYSLNQLGDNSYKTILLASDSDDLSVKKTLELDGIMPINMYIDDYNNILYIIYKEDSLKTYGRLKIINLTDYKEINNIPFDFVPTDVVGHNGYYYVMNEYEDYFALGENTTKDFSKNKKYLGNENANDIFICKTIRKDDFLYDENGRYIDENGKLLDYKGNLINEKNQKVNKYGQILDDYGRAINTNGELIDRYENIIDENGVIIKYTLQPDGYYRSGNGKIVDNTGKAMIKQEDGSYKIDETIIPDLQWHYDENGKVQINADYLEKYPDAKSWIDEKGNYIKGQSVIKHDEVVESESKAEENNNKKWYQHIFK